MSLRLAIKRSLEEPEEEAAVEKERSNRPKKEPVVVELPKINKVIRNTTPSRIDDDGFVEIAHALPQNLIVKIYQEAIEKVGRYEQQCESSPGKRKRQQPPGEIEEISNALQADVSDELLQNITESVKRCAVTQKTMRAVFGKHGVNYASNYEDYIIETPKILITKPGSNPQLPHADDMCTSCVICLIQLRDGQEPTRIAKYEGKRKDYPTGITVECDTCNRYEQLPDADFRRGVHLTDEVWHCDCSSQHTPYDFEGKVSTSFGELLEENAPNLCDAYAGKKTPKAGDGLLCLPTLIHRGPGNPTSAKESRYMLFFTMRPVYKNAKRPGVDKSHHKYNPSLQIHAPCVLYNQFKKVKTIYEGSGCDIAGYLKAIVGAEDASLRKEVDRLKEENEQLRIRCDGFESLSSEVARLREENTRLKGECKDRARRVS